MNLKLEIFYRWLKNHHPGVELMAWQHDWLRRYFSHDLDAMISMDLPKACGKTFLTNLVMEFLRWYPTASAAPSLAASPSDYAIHVRFGYTGVDEFGNAKYACKAYIPSIGWVEPAERDGSPESIGQAVTEAIVGLMAKAAHEGEELTG